MTARGLFAADLNHVLDHTRSLWEEVRSARLFLTGATGFFGAWLVESFLHANAVLKLGAQVVVLTRDADAARQRLACLTASTAVGLHVGDVRDFSSPAGTFDLIIHGATESSRHQHGGDPRYMFDTIVGGTRRVLAFARESGARRFLLVSSGAVYGRQPPEVDRVPEDFSSAPDVWNAGNAYAEGKRAAELLCAIESSKELSTRAGRCFAFVGPHLPLDAHFAIGNFIRDGLAGGPIRIRGDGTAIRSYLYMADLAIWLWTIALSPNASGPYNVGSENAISMVGLAEQVSIACAPGVAIEVAARASSGVEAHRYVPSTRHAEMSLGLVQHIPLREAIRRTAAWYSGSAFETTT